jgi:hypothetical protein
MTMLSTAVHLNGLASGRLSNAIEERACLLANIALALDLRTADSSRSVSLPCLSADVPSEHLGAIHGHHTALWEHLLTYRLLDYQPSDH